MEFQALAGVPGLGVKQRISVAPHAPRFDR